jgi:hypothetical protein
MIEVALLLLLKKSTIRIIMLNNKNRWEKQEIKLKKIGKQNFLIFKKFI